MIAGTASGCARATWTYLHVDDVADDFVPLALAYKRLQSEEVRPNATGLEHGLGSTLDKGVRRLSNRVWWSMQAYTVLGAKDGDPVYRLEWMEAQLRTISTRLKLAKGGEKLSFEEQCAQLFDTSVDPSYVDQRRTDDIIIRLHNALPSSNMPLHLRAHAHRERHLIPHEQYEPVFRKLVDDVIDLMKERVPELQQTCVRQKYVNDMSLCFEATCEPGLDASEMIVNVARPITWDKAQQLSTHELTHHMQFILMEQYLYPSCPEMRASLDEGPMGMLLEGGAELAVDLFLPPVDRQRDLVRRVPVHLKTEVPAMLAVERLTWDGLWHCSIRIARDFVNGTISKAEAERAMLESALKPNDSWPNVAFFESYGAYAQSYGWGKELILEYLKTRPGHATLLDAFVAFTKRPPTPSRMRREIEAWRAKQPAQPLPSFVVPVELRDTPQYGAGHKGVFPTAPIKAGTKIWQWSDRVITMHHTKLPAMLDAMPRDKAALLLRQSFVLSNNPDYLNMNPLDAGRFVNHSSKPNIGEVALVDISAGQELLMDYSGHGNPDWYQVLCSHYVVRTENEIAKMHQ